MKIQTRNLLNTKLIEVLMILLRAPAKIRKKGRKG
jgi:hypothetical protein